MCLSATTPCDAEETHNVPYKSPLEGAILFGENSLRRVVQAVCFTLQRTSRIRGYSQYRPSALQAEPDTPMQ